MTLASRPVAGPGAAPTASEAQPGSPPTVSGPALAASVGWRDRLRRWFEALVADPRRQRWFAAFPLTRPLVLRRSAELFDLVSGFVYTQVLLAALRLGLLEQARAAPLDAATVAARGALPLDSAERLLAACAAVRLLSRRRDGRYVLGPLGMPLVGRPEIATLVEHNTLLYHDLADPVALLRQGRSGATALARFWAYGAAGPGAVAAGTAASYSQVMSASLPLVLHDVLDAYPFERHRVMLDIGGGEGRFVRAVAARAPRLAVHLFDLPPVAERAAAALAAEGLAGRVTVHGGSFAHDPLPAGADLVTLVRVVHDHDDDLVRVLFRRVWEVLPPGGTLLVAEPMAGLRGAERVGDAYFAFYLLAMASGRARSVTELEALLRGAGFRDVAPMRPRTPVQAGLIVARK